MKTIAQFVQDGITTIADLKAALQTAMRLEFATIPPYLCAQWSINSDPSHVGAMIQGIVLQEMFHFALAGNMLTAIGGTPTIANANFIPAYPTNVLPGGIPQKLPVNLQPLSLRQLEVFMQVEFPEFPPVALAAVTGTAAVPTTIGAFYDTISEGLAAANPAIDAKAHFVNMGEAVQIKTIVDAQAAIARIKREGEGTLGSPNQPPVDGAQLAHYYVFKEILKGKTLVQSGGTWTFGDPAIQFPTVFNFAQSTASPDPSIAFNRALTKLLIDLQACWASGKAPDIGAMFQLQKLGTDLIKQGIRPGFQWAAPSGA
jgi:hypothetical protein